MHIKKGDQIKVLSGYDKNKISEVIKVYKKTGKITVKNVNFKIKYKKSNTTNKRIKIEAPIHHSNVKLFK